MCRRNALLFHRYGPNNVFTMVVYVRIVDNGLVGCVRVRHSLVVCTALIHTPSRSRGARRVLFTDYHVMRL
jgi:hypothetical protein